ncbi:MAG: hypothetical protein U0324_40395 [Polyangiales bacterium]
MARTMPSGVHVQIYRDAVPDVASLDAALDALRALGVAGIAWHGTTHELTPDVFGPLHEKAAARGMISFAAFGLGRGANKSPETAGERIAAVARTPGCAGVVFDAEHLWEDARDDKAKAAALMTAFREAAPDALAVDQPWPIPTSHGSFPWEAFYARVDVTAPQVYCNNWRQRWGRDAYERFEAWHLASWRSLEERIARAGLAMPPKINTRQGYRWFLDDCVTMLCREPTVIVWCEPYPDRTFRFALEAVRALAGRGFAGPDAVRAFQADARAAGAYGGAVDGRFGREAARALGLEVPSGVLV